MQQTTDNQLLIPVKSPMGGYQIWHKDFYNLSANEVEDSINLKGDYMPYGYKYFYFCKSTGSVHCFKERPTNLNLLKIK